MSELTEATLTTVNPKAPLSKDCVAEPNAFQEAVNAGGEGLVGVDGSGNDWEFAQNIGSTAISKALLENQPEAEA